VWSTEIEQEIDMRQGLLALKIRFYAPVFTETPFGDLDAYLRESKSPSQGREEGHVVIYFLPGDWGKSKCGLRFKV
jgi:hypothetical protein